jgi:hypothetical protein
MKKLNRKQLEQNRRKQERNKEKKEFIAGMHRIADLLGGEGTFALLPPHVVENAYRYRSLPLKPNIQHDPELDMKSACNLHHMVAVLSRWKEYYINIKGVDFTLTEFMTSGFTVVRIATTCRTEEVTESWQTEFASRFNPTFEKELTDQAFRNCEMLALVLTLGEYNLQRDLFWFKFELTPPHEGSNQLQYVMYQYREKLETRIFNTASGDREALRVCFATVSTGPKYAHIDPSELGVDHPHDKVPVYIQRHAVHRLEERLEGLRNYNLQFSVFESFNKPIVVRQHKNRVLIACCINNVKMGYFAAEYIQEALLIHTFLFITHDGTPEGNKLSELTGLGKLDKKYLAIDRLSSFISSDISQNIRLRNLFCTVGCSCLFEINELVSRSALKQDGQVLSEMILKYLEIGE